MDNLVERVAKAIGRDVYEIELVGDELDHCRKAALAIIPIVMEEAANLVAHFGETASAYGPALATRTAIAQSIRTRSSEIAGLSKESE